MTKSPLLHLTADEVRGALPMNGAISAMRDAFAQLSRGEVTLPTRLRLDAPGDNGAALVMACHSSTERMFSVKIATVYPNNPEHGLPAVQSVLIVTDGATGTPIAVMDAAVLTAIRTGAASGLATDLLARPEAKTVAIIGAGVQARTQLEAVCCVRAIKMARVYCRTRVNGERFAVEMGRQLGIAVECANSPREALKDADIICTATPSTTPVFADEDVGAGAHINAIGSFRPAMVEIPSATVCRARIVVDHFASALEEAGDLIGPLRMASILESEFTELGDVVLGKAVGRGSAEEITLFKSVGVAIQDLCAAVRAVNNLKLTRQ